MNETMNALLEEILAQLAKTTGPVMLHGGHFRLVAHEARAYPAVEEELVETKLPRDMMEAVRFTVGNFPLATFKLCLLLAKRLEEQSREVSIVTLVDDCMHSTMRYVSGDAKKMREEFYTSAPSTLEVYQSAFARSGLPSRFLGFAKHGSLLSEAWLRHRFEKRLQRIKRSPLGMIVIKDENGIERLEGLNCPLTNGGQTNCAGEVAELHLMLKEHGYGALVNFYPLMCRSFVQISAEIADTLEGLDGYRSFNIGLHPGTQTEEELLRSVDKSWGSV